MRLLVDDDYLDRLNGLPDRPNPSLKRGNAVRNRAFHLTTVACAAGAILTTASARATTTYQRIAASTCAGYSEGVTDPITQYYETVGSDYYGFITFNSGSSGSYVYMSCPFIDSDVLPDSSATSLTVDWICPSYGGAGGGEYNGCIADAFAAAACTYSSWSLTCGAYQGNQYVADYTTPFQNVSVPLTAWSDDSGNGYAYVAVRSETRGSGEDSQINQIAGITVEYTH